MVLVIHLTLLIIRLCKQTCERLSLQTGGPDWRLTESTRRTSTWWKSTHASNICCRYRHCDRRPTHVCYKKQTKHYMPLRKCSVLSSYFSHCLFNQILTLTKLRQQKFFQTRYNLWHLNNCLSKLKLFKLFVVYFYIMLSIRYLSRRQDNLYTATKSKVLPNFWETALQSPEPLQSSFIPPYRKSVQILLSNLLR